MTRRQQLTRHTGRDGCSDHGPCRTVVLRKGRVSVSPTTALSNLDSLQTLAQDRTRELRGLGGEEVELGVREASAERDAWQCSVWEQRRQDRRAPRLAALAGGALRSERDPPVHCRVLSSVPGLYSTLDVPPTTSPGADCHLWRVPVPGAHPGPGQWPPAPTQLCSGLPWAGSEGTSPQCSSVPT